MRVFLTIALLLLFTRNLGATTAQLNAQITINEIPASILTTQVMSLKLAKTTGKTSYAATDLRSIIPAQFLVTQEPHKFTITSVPVSVNLSNGSASAILGLTCRSATGGYVTTVSQGIDCSTNIMTNDGLVYISIYPTTVLFSTENKIGTYLGTVTITTDYL